MILINYCIFIMLCYKHIQAFYQQPTQQLYIMIGKYINKVSSYFKDSITEFHVQRLLRYYHKNQYKNVMSVLNSQKNYAKIKIHEYPFIMFLLQEKNKECLKFFLQNATYKKYALEDQQNPLSIPPILFAYLQLDEQIIQILEQNDAKIYHTNSLKHNLVHLAVIHNKLQTLKRALANKVDYDAIDIYMNTPLHYAAKSGNVQIVKQLLKKNPKRNVLNQESKYPVHLAVQSQNLENFNLFLKDLASLQFDTKLTCHPIHIAAQIKNIQILKQIIKFKNTLINLPGPNELYPLHYAVMANNIDAVRQLIKNKCLINKQDEYNNTALHVAALENRSQIAIYLVQNGADVEKKNIDELTAIDCLYNSKGTEVIKYLQGLGRKDLNQKYFNSRY